MTWILALITLASFGVDVNIKKVGVFPDQEKCEATRQALEANAERGHTYICIKHEKEE